MSQRTFTYYRTSDGAYAKTLTAPDKVSADLNLEPGLTYVEGDYGPKTSMVDGIVTSRKQDDLQEERLEAQRREAVASVQSVLMSLGPTDLGGTGHLTEDEMLALRKGDLPPKVLAVTRSKKGHTLTRMDLSGSTLRRNDALVAVLSQAFNVDAASMDAAFDIGPN